MPLNVNWNEVIRENDPYEANDFRNAAYHLLTSQVLYEAGHNQGPHYRLISRYLSAFRDVFDMIGINIVLNPTYRFVAAVPIADKQPQMKSQDAMLLLVLRKAYHEHASKGNLDFGSAVISIEELHEIYRTETGRELPVEVGALKGVLSPMKSCGVVTLSKSDTDQPFDITILPGIEALVNENTLARLTEYRGSQNQNQNEGIES